MNYKILCIFHQLCHPPDSLVSCLFHFNYFFLVFFKSAMMSSVILIVLLYMKSLLKAGFRFCVISFFPSSSSTTTPFHHIYHLHIVLFFENIIRAFFHLSNSPRNFFHTCVITIVIYHGMILLHSTQIFKELFHCASD